MTTISRKSLITSFIFTCALSTLSIACSEDKDDNGEAEPFRALAPLTVAMEVPPPTGTTEKTTGVFAYELNEETGVMKYTLTVGDLTGPATDAHIHKGAAGMAGMVVKPLAVPTAPMVAVEGMVTLDAASLVDLKAGLLYVNVHTAANPAGEVRGQLQGPKN